MSAFKSQGGEYGILCGHVLRKVVSRCRVSRFISRLFDVPGQQCSRICHSGGAAVRTLGMVIAASVLILVGLLVDPAGAMHVYGVLYYATELSRWMLEKGDGSGPKAE